MENKKYYFISNLTVEEKTAMKIQFRYSEGDYDYYKAVSSKIKATKQNLALLRNFIVQNTMDYKITPYDCNGSPRTRFVLKRKKNKCWLKESTTYDY